MWVSGKGPRGQLNISTIAQNDTHCQEYHQRHDHYAQCTTIEESNQIEV